MNKNEGTYTVANLAAVYDQIKHRKAQNKVCSYRIQVDGNTVVKRTYDLREFYTFRHSITAETKTVSIRIYARFFAVENFDLSLNTIPESCRAGHEHNRELAHENIRLFSEVLDKDIEIFDLRERLARAQQKNGSRGVRSIGSVQVVDLGDTVMVVVPKEKFHETLDAFEKQLNEQRGMLNEIRGAVRTKKS